MARKRKSENEIVVSAPTPARHKSPAAARPRRPQPPVAATTEMEPASAPVEPALGTPSHDEIAALAYSYWEARGCQGGCPAEDWVRAEAELRTRRGTVSVAHA